MKIKHGSKKGRKKDKHIFMVAIMRGSLMMFYDTFEPVIIILGWNPCCNNIAGAAIVF